VKAEAGGGGRISEAEAGEEMESGVGNMIFVLFFPNLGGCIAQREVVTGVCAVVGRGNRISNHNIPSVQSSLPD
jgi:hypothetical protein